MHIARKFEPAILAGEALPDGAIRLEVEGGPFPLSSEQHDELIRALEHSFTTTQRRGATVVSDYRPWLRDRRASIDFYYWNRLRLFYLEGNVLPPPVVATLDTVTSELLDYCGNPADTGSWSRRGMVMGHVQSGKTTNYSALICKAADAGYRIVILLAGITNSLRSQTQERLDETFIGKKSVFQAIAQEALPIQTYAMPRRTPAYGTTRDRDFTRDAAGVYFSLDAHLEPIIFVTKKNKTTLERLRDWLSEQAQGGKIHLPLLMIDDEADNASINTSTNPNQVTAINRVMREILALFDRSSYVGYTATPFANIFIDPDTTSDMEADDLFPRHFIKELEPPSNYVGARRMIQPDGNLRADTVRTIDDFVAFLPLSHKRDHPVTELPPSLYRAVRVFLISRAIRVLQGKGRSHCSMMINVSRFNDVQEKVYGLVYGYLTTLQSSIVVGSGLGPARLSDPNLVAIAEDFEDEFSESGFSLEQIFSVLNEASESVVVKTVNMRGGQLDYSAHKDHGLHVIAIGGLALSRGLTLEGLTVSYILRNVAASDTLMQMARWFGYRPGYERLCRLYLPELALDHYEEVHLAIEELHAEIKRMQLLQMTPEQFGLRVRQSQTAIRITAANKMRSASAMTVAQDYSTRHIEGYALVNSDKVNQENLEAVAALVQTLGKPSSSFPEDRALIWAGVAGEQVAALLRGFRFSEAHADLGIITGNTSLLIDYVSDRLKSDLSDWDIAIPYLANGNPRSDILPGYAIPVRSRNSGKAVDSVYRVTGSKNRVADPGDVMLGLSAAQKHAAEEEKERVDGLRGERAYCAQRQRPLLLIHLFDAKVNEGALQIGSPVVTLGFCFPPTSVEPMARTYQVNVVFRRQLDLFRDEVDDDEAVIGSPQDA